MRRGASLVQAIHIYNSFLATIMRLESDGHAIVVLRYEDVIADPLGATRQAYAHCDLDEAGASGFVYRRRTPGRMEP